MIVLDLQVVVFLLLLGAAVFGVGIWFLVTLLRQRSRSVSRSLVSIEHELPLGVAILGPTGDVQQSNAEAQRLLYLVSEHHRIQSRGVFDLLGIKTTQQGATSGRMTHPVALRWWSYPREAGASVLVLLDTSDQQRAVRQQQAFVGQLAHEMRTPLTALIAHLAVARSPLTPEALRESSLAIAERESSRPARLMRDLLELHRLEVATDLHLQPLNIVLVAEDAITQLFPHIEEAGLALTFEAAEPLRLVIGHANRLKQVFLNLLDNAIKFAHPTTTIVVALQTVPQGVLCRVSDTGPGIARDDLPHICQPLYRGQTHIDGNGIGLAVVQEILVHHHTTLQIESSTSSAHTGTTCSWILPYASGGETS